MDHAVNAIRHFILKFDTDSMDDFLKTSVQNIEIVKGNLVDLNNYITKLDDIEDRFAKLEKTLTKFCEFDKKLLSENSKLEEMEKFIHNKLESIESITQMNSNDRDHTVLQKINELNQLCNELNHKVDNSKHTTYHRSPQIADLEELISAKFDSLKSLSTENVTITHKIHKVEEICSNLHRKMDFFTNQHPPNAPYTSTPYVRRQVMSNSIPFTPHNIRHQAPNYNTTRCNTIPTPEAHTTPRDCVILGDSNSKYVTIDTNHIRTTRIPTYRITDINPEHCVGYSRIWIHVGINDLKTRNCRGPADVHMYYSLLLEKLHRIRQLCPNSKLIVSPILPTGVPALNERARLFNNNLLYTGPQWFELLDFRVYCGTDGRLQETYRCYSNVRDRIHLGRIGIELLKDKLISSISKVDTRSYSTVLRTGQPQNHR